MKAGDENKRIIYTTSDGDVVVVHPANKSPTRTIEQVQAKAVPSGVTSYIVDKSVIPTDRSFRDAWTYTP